MSLASGVRVGGIESQAQLPADVRTGPRARRDAYEAGLGFERLLVQQLSQSLTDSARDALGGDSPYASLLPDALTDGLMDGGGLGLARQLATSLAGDPLAIAGERNPTPPAANPADRAGGVAEDDSRDSARGNRLAPRQDPPAAAPEAQP